MKTRHIIFATVIVVALLAAISIDVPYMGVIGWGVALGTLLVWGIMVVRTGNRKTNPNDQPVA